MVSLPGIDATQAGRSSYSPTLLAASLFKIQLQPDYQIHNIKVDAVPLSDRIDSISRQLALTMLAPFISY